MLARHLAVGVAATAIASVAGCASAPTGARAKEAAAVSSSPAIQVGTYVPVVASKEIDFSDENEKVVPISPDTPGLVTSDTAYDRNLKALLATGLAGDQTGPVTGSLYAYYNSAHGEIQADGTVKLDYQGTPVWMFLAPVKDGILPNEALPGGSVLTGTDCESVYIIDARSGDPMTSFEECATTRAVPNPYTPSSGTATPQ